MKRREEKRKVSTAALAGQYCMCNIGIYIYAVVEYASSSSAAQSKEDQHDSTTISIYCHLEWNIIILCQRGSCACFRLLVN